MVFEGRKNQFDARKGLSATTVREFDKAISMVSNGFGDIHAFYEYSSSRSWIDNIEVPLLCIQASQHFP
jgi:predicted alpha/beta-fold hydrolase